MIVRSLALLLWAATAQAAPGLWAAWDLTLGDHAPPTHFVVSVTSSDVPDTPLFMSVPWARCGAFPRVQYCAPIGCPGTGTYTFWVQATYAEGLSARSPLVTCVSLGRLACACMDPGSSPGAITPDPAPARPVLLPRDPPAPPDLGLIEEPPPLSDDVPPLPQRDDSGLDLHPVGALSPIPTPPPVPACEHFCDVYSQQLGSSSAPRPAQLAPPRPRRSAPHARQP